MVASVAALAAVGEPPAGGKVMVTVFVIIFGIAFLLWHYLVYNSFVSRRNAIDQSWSNTEIELKRRLDLIGSLVEVVKGYAKHEAETLLSVVAARGSKSLTANAELASSSNELIRETLGGIFALVESYPELKANNQFLQLQSELTNTENRIAERRHAYNQNVSLYENLRLSFPANIVAWVHRYAAASFFDVSDEDINSAVAVKL